jgi:hypothetical protein
MAETPQTPETADDALPQEPLDTAAAEPTTAPDSPAIEMFDLVAELAAEPEAEPLPTPLMAVDWSSTQPSEPATNPDPVDAAEEPVATAELETVASIEEPMLPSFEAVGAASAEPPPAPEPPSATEPPPEPAQPEPSPEPTVAAREVSVAAAMPPSPPQPQRAGIAATLVVPPLEPGEGGEWDLLVGKVRAWFDGADLQARWESIGGPVRAVGLLLAALVLLRIYTALLDTLGELPLLPRLLQLVGLVAVLRFAVTRLVRTSERERILGDWHQRWNDFRGRD